MTLSRRHFLGALAGIIALPKLAKPEPPKEFLVTMKVTRSTFEDDLYGGLLSRQQMKAYRYAQLYAMGPDRLNEILHRPAPYFTVRPRA